MFKTVLIVAALAACSVDAQTTAPAGDARTYEYKVLATSRTSTMDKEMNEAAHAGFRFGSVMGGDTAGGGKEVVTVMYRGTPAAKPCCEYRLLATSRTSTMQKEMQEVADAGFVYRGQTVFQSAFGGKEVAVIMERDREDPAARYEFRLLATSRTSTMEKELAEAGLASFEIVGMTVGKTAMGGNELVTIMRRPAK
ncbi:MAG TPA: hypothetical protein VN442_10765 [Bryobacteraceae bacterium]|nr:hypothetical protein [Bryobacteraceae bacterium]